MGRTERLAQTDYKDPVELSGGPLSGTIVEGQGWKSGTEKTFDVQSKSGKKGRYRRLEDDNNLTSDHCVWCGLEDK